MESIFPESHSLTLFTMGHKRHLAYTKTSMATSPFGVESRFDWLCPGIPTPFFVSMESKALRATLSVGIHSNRLKVI